MSEIGTFTRHLPHAKRLLEARIASVARYRSLHYLIEQLTTESHSLSMGSYHKPEAPRGGLGAETGPAARASGLCSLACFIAQ